MVLILSLGSGRSNTEAAVSSAVLPKKHKVMHCPSVHKAMRWYHGRWHYYLKLRDALPAHKAHDPGKRCGWARFLARRWQRRAATARKEYAKWFSDRGQTIARLEHGLRGSPMSGTGIILEREGRKYGVSPYFMVAVAATESSIGRAACSNNRFNVWGLASCVNSWPVPYFNSWDEAIRFYANFLASRWPGHSTPYSFRGYAACSDCWARKVSSWMVSLFGVPAVTRYP